MGTLRPPVCFVQLLSSLERLLKVKNQNSRTQLSVLLMFHLFNFCVVLLAGQLLTQCFIQVHAICTWMLGCERKSGIGTGVSLPFQEGCKARCVGCSGFYVGQPTPQCKGHHGTLQGRIPPAPKENYPCPRKPREVAAGDFIEDWEREASRTQGQGSRRHRVQGRLLGPGDSDQLTNLGGRGGGGSGGPTLGGGG